MPFLRIWRRARDYSGRPALHPCGAALHAFKFAPGKFVEPGSEPSPHSPNIRKNGQMPFLRIWRRARDYSGRPALHPCGAALRAFKFAPGKFVEPGSEPSPHYPNILKNGRMPFLRIWRRARDSNPRYGSPYTPLAGVRLQPLGQLSRIQVFSVNERIACFNMAHCARYSGRPALRPAGHQHKTLMF